MEGADRPDRDDKEAARSCEDRIQNDLSDLENNSSNIVRAVRSLRENSCSGSDFYSNKDADLEAQEERRNIMINKLKEARNPGGIKEEFSNFNNKQFGTEILHSEEVSYEDSANGGNSFRSEQEDHKNFLATNSDIHVLKEKRLQQIFQPMPFNVMLAGATALGKSCFIDAFLNVKYERLPVIRDRTDGIKSIPSTRDFKDFKLELTFIDTPGYLEGQVEEYIELVTDFVIQKFEEHKKKEDQSFRKSKLALEDNGFKDERPHCCLYFLKGPRVEESDWRIMKQLQNYVSILPVIAKGDTYTIDELKDIKANIKTEKRKRNLEWFDLQEYMRQKHPEKVQTLLNGPFGESPPFVLSGCLEKVLVAEKRKDGMAFCRTYKWGTCYLDNPNHTDFCLLKNLLIYYLSPHFNKVTETYYKVYFRKQDEGLRQRLERSETHNTYSSMIIVGSLVVAVAGLVALGTGFFGKGK